MSTELNNVLLKAYNQWKDHEDPPVPIPEIKEFLESEGVSFGNNE